MRTKATSPLLLAALGAGTMLLSFIYHVYAMGFPIPVPHASRYTDEEMTRINSPNLMAEIIFYCGLAIFFAGLGLMGLRFLRSRR